MCVCVHIDGNFFHIHWSENGLCNLWSTKWIFHLYLRIDYTLLMLEIIAWNPSNQNRNTIIRYILMTYSLLIDHRLFTPQHMMWWMCGYIHHEWNDDLELRSFDVNLSFCSPKYMSLIFLHYDLWCDWPSMNSIGIDGLYNDKIHGFWQRCVRMIDFQFEILLDE